MTYADLGALHQYCVDRINMYRSGQLKFSDNSADLKMPVSPLIHYQGNDVCSNEAALGDMVGSSGGCDNGHANAFVCGGGSGANAWYVVSVILLHKWMISFFEHDVHLK